VEAAGPRRVYRRFAQKEAWCNRGKKEELKDSRTISFQKLFARKFSRASAIRQ
jgi:hypothetical protein